jgi:xylulokinase
MAPAEDVSIILAIDLGTGGPKASLVDAAGEVLCTAFEPTPLIHTEDGGIEQSAEDWWRAITAAARAAMAQAPSSTPAPRAVAVTAQWATTLAIDERGMPLMNAISWMDGRGANYAHEAVGPAPRVSGYNPVKIARWIRKTGGAPSLQGHDPVGQILMIADRHPDVFERAAYFVEPGDYITARMTGNVVAPPESQTLTWGTDNREIDAIAYDDGLIAMSGLPKEKLAPLVPSGSVVGELLPECAAELGIAPVPVITSSPDIMSAAVGSGAVADGAMHLYIGTSGWLSGHVPYKRTDVFHNIATLPSSIPGRYLVTTEQQTAGRSFEHLRNELLGLPEISFSDLVAEAESVRPGSEGVIFTPWLNGERTPLDDLHTRASYTNLSLKSSRAALVRATFEGVAMNVRWMHQHTEKLMKQRVDDIALIGGGAEADLWCQIFSDVLDRQVRRIEQPRSANVRGAALLAALALDELSVDQIPSRVRSDVTFTPDPANRALYDERFDEFKSFYKANRKMFARLNAAPKEH